MNTQNPHRYWYCPICFYIMTEEQSKEYRGCQSPKTDILQVHLAQHKWLDLPSLLKAAGRDADTEISEAHDLLFSACEIARRNGDNTNWNWFLTRVEQYLATQNIRGVSAKTFRLQEEEEEQSEQRKALMDDKERMNKLQEWANSYIVTFAVYSNKRMDLTVKHPTDGLPIHRSINAAKDLRDAIDRIIDWEKRREGLNDNQA